VFGGVSWGYEMKNSHGLTLKQEKFAQEIVKGESQSSAYRAAYDCENASDSTVYSEASRLMDNPKVSSRISGLLKAQEEAMLRDTIRLRQHVIRRLVEESEDFAKGTATSRVAATVALGKTNVVRLFTEVDEGDKSKDVEDLERKLQDKLREYFSDNGPDLPIVGTNKNKDRSD
jgi:phage terminase small subunit